MWPAGSMSEYCIRTPEASWRSRAVTRALDRKRRLGQYAVFWEDGRETFDGPDAPTQQEEPAEGSRIGLGSAAPFGTECPETGTERSRS